MAVPVFVNGFETWIMTNQEVRQHSVFTNHIVDYKVKDILKTKYKSNRFKIKYKSNRFIYKI